MVAKETPQKDKAILVAEYFILKSKQDPKSAGLDKLKLQKLLYYAQAWNLVFNKARLFSNKIEAWVHGPAVPEVWQFFDGAGINLTTATISEDISDFFKTEEKKVMDDVWKIYGKYDGPYLEALTHNELPWQEARKDLGPGQSSNNIISEELMQQYYGKRLTEAKAESLKAT